uniref:Uncharacterized protein n=1 Tax=Rhizophora mucronata TaxID=61149 RepID=A0A2P2Q577_RHIMU
MIKSSLTMLLILLHCYAWAWLQILPESSWQVFSKKVS